MSVCNCCEPLREEIAVLKRELAQIRSARRLEEIQAHFKLQPTAARLLTMLYEANGRALNGRQLDACAATPGNYRVWICYVRKVLSPGAIVRDGVGIFRLSEVGLAEVKAILEPENATP